MKNSKKMFDLEQSIANWIKEFSKHKAYDEGSIQEMELHLRDHVEDLIQGGQSSQEAFKLAVKEFGSVPEVANEEYSNIRNKPSFKTLLFSAMLNNYFKSTTRNMMKNPLTSFINVFGLSVAIGISLVVYSFLDMDYSIDRFHENEDELYLATLFINREGTEEQYGISPSPMGKMLEGDFSSIENMCRIIDLNGILKHGDNVFPEQVRCVDPSFLEMFTFPLEQGDASSLKDPNSIVISHDMAIKYFADDNPIGREILIKFTEDLGKTFIVSGVAQDFPFSHAVHFDFLVNIENYTIANPKYDFNDWSNMLSATLIQVKNFKDLEIIKNGLDKYRELQNEAEKDWAIGSFEMVKFKDLHFRSRDIRNDISRDSFYEGRVVLPILALFMLVLACFNYINMAIVSAAKRLKEIGLRKVIGASRSRIIIQFLSENIFTTLFALLIGLGLATTLFLPWFVNLAEMHLELKLLDTYLWLFLVTLLLITGIISGIYPALYISKFQVVHIFKGVIKFGTKNVLTKVFLTVQLILACVGITCAIMFTQNSEFQAEKSWGYNQNDVLYAYTANEAMFNRLKAAMKQNPNVLSISGSSHHLGKQSATQISRTPDHEYEVLELAVDPSYFKTMELDVKVGSAFLDTDIRTNRNVVVNELFVESFDLEEPISKIFKIGDDTYRVVGVVNDFHFNNFYYENTPAVFTVADKEHYKYLTMKVEEGEELETYESLQEEWSSLFPETPFQGGYQEDVWGNFYHELEIQERFMKTIAYIAVLLAALGLYGLVTLNVAGRVREFSVRKILGAGVDNIAISIYKQYAFLSFIAVLLGAPISYTLSKANIDMMYPEAAPISYSGVTMAVIILLVVMAMVIATQVRKISKSNPVEGLKVE